MISNSRAIYLNYQLSHMHRHISPYGRPHNPEIYFHLPRKLDNNVELFFKWLTIKELYITTFHCLFAFDNYFRELMSFIYLIRRQVTAQ